MIGSGILGASECLVRSLVGTENMRIAVLSDVHSNFHALKVVLSDLEHQGVDQVLCLGDLVGYATFPNELIRLLSERQIPTVLSNYDEAVGLDLNDCGCEYREPELDRLGKLWPEHKLALCQPAKPVCAIWCPISAWKSTASGYWQCAAVRARSTSFCMRIGDWLRLNILPGMPIPMCFSVVIPICPTRRKWPACCSSTQVL